MDKYIAALDDIKITPAVYAKWRVLGLINFRKLHGKRLSNELFRLLEDGSGELFVKDEATGEDLLVLVLESDDFQLNPMSN
jgi:hypothetical protein